MTYVLIARKLDKIEEQEYNINEISEYASKTYYSGKYDETNRQDWHSKQEIGFELKQGI